ncbi:enterotoxin A family protein [Serratia rubidaea]|nr:enterotoxin A family protein [Serratia rubidaea]WBF47709.1 enterotoxin A family protein [Serratia rubidaea]
MDPLGLSCKPEVVYRGDKRHPKIIFREGFQPLGDSKNVYLHAVDNKNPPSNFISTSMDMERSVEFASMYNTPGFLYIIKKPNNGVDVNKFLGNKSPYPHEAEIAVPGSISPKDIIGVTPINADGSFVGFSFLNPLR